jgi:tripartite-type tricarboxylate transporter receptor subunit TctC
VYIRGEIAMKESSMKTVITALAAAASIALGGAATAQNKFPSHAVTLTVGFAAGGGTDTAARIIAKKLSENIGQPVIVDNKAGAGGNIAAQHIATAPPDGYTIHLTSVGPMSIAPHLAKNLPYDAKKDIAPITMGVIFPNEIVIYPGVPAKTLAEYVALAKAKPGELNYASSGIGGIGHLAGELFKQRAGIDLVHVPYKGGGPAMADLLACRCTSACPPP